MLKADSQNDCWPLLLDSGSIFKFSNKNLHILNLHIYQIVILT